MLFITSEFSGQRKRCLARWLEIWREYARAPLPALPPPKEFKPKFELPKLDSYSEPAPEWYWEKFPSNLVQPATSLIDPEKLRLAAIASNFPDKTLLNQICLDIKVGADIGCRGIFREPSTATNAPSAIDNGYRVSDSIAEWVAKKFAYGPVKPSEVPVSAKFAGLMTREKPNGAVRVILNLSAPVGHSVNDGIDTTGYPTSMASTDEWVSALNRAGKGSYMCKVDYASAYKHIPVSMDDSNLQWFMWAGRCFKELSLVFGCASSAGIFDRLAKCVLHVVVTKADFPANQVSQYLDDCCACSASLQEITRYDETFFKVASDLGIELASRDDPDKSFGPSKQGVILGIHYDTEAWIWYYPYDKLIRLLHNLQFVMDNNEARQDFLQSVLGKIIHVAPLVPSGKFNLLHLIKGASQTSVSNQRVPIGAQLKRQAWFWYSTLRSINGKVSIPNPLERLPAWAVEVFTDAAGGSLDNTWRGVGAVSRDWWVQCPWSTAINAGHRTPDGKRLDRLLSALELTGPLLGLTSAAKHLQGRPVRFWVDNAGSVFIFKKGYSPSCPLSSVLVAALGQVAAALGCKIEVLKISRCSDPFSSMADALSKGAFCRFRDLGKLVPDWAQPSAPLQVSRVLMKWLVAPTEDWDLGSNLVKELELNNLGLQPQL